MKINVEAISGHAAAFAWIALRSFVGTTVLFVSIGLALSGISYYCLREHSWIYGMIAAAIALIEAAVVGAILGTKRAIAAAAANGIATMRPGQSMVRLIFEHMLQVTDGATDERGECLARGLDRLPFAKADEMLRGAIGEVKADAEKRGWFRSKIQAKILDGIRGLTLARFREEGAKHGGVDLHKVKGELERHVDDALMKKVLEGTRGAAVFAMIALLAVVALQIGAAMILASSKS